MAVTFRFWAIPAIFWKIDRNRPEPILITERLGTFANNIIKNFHQLFQIS